MKTKENIRIFVGLFLIIAVFSGAMFALNLHTGPLAEENRKGAVFAPLLAVMPEGAGFGADALIYDAADPAASALTGVPEQVMSIYQEESGMGYAVRCSATSQYSKEPMELTLGVSAEGIICGLQVDAYHESISFLDQDPAYVGTYLGKDSALADVGTVAGVTYSSTAFKDSVSAGLTALISNGLIKEGVKSDAQILSEMIPAIHSGLAVDGNLKADPVEPSGNILSGFTAQNGSGSAFVMGEADATYLAVCNADGVCRVFDVEGNDVTDQHAALAEEASAAVGTDNAFLDAAMNKFAKMVPDAADMEPVALNCFNTVVAAAKFNAAGGVCYGFYARSIGFEQMDLYYVLDENGAIVAADAKSFIFEEEYFANFGGMDKDSYKQGFVGLTQDSYDGSQTVIATATMTSNAVRQATDDVFAAFAAIRTGEE